MVRSIISKLLLTVCILALTNGARAQTTPKHELRAIWIATVNNIDWPSKPGLSSDIQKEELCSLLDLAKKYNLNTIVFQVRPAADALYKSEIEPWSQWLSGEQGIAPDPYYDPLAFAIEECRKRGLDIHAWLNPYRAVKDTSYKMSPDHITVKHPEWFLTYGSTVYFDPGLPETRDYVASVVADIVRRYDIDAIHMDDYFYPYRIAKVEFPDDSSFTMYPRGFTVATKEDWRRDNVNLIIKQLSDSIKAVKPWVEFGISPFGVWRNIDKDPAGSDTKAGQTNYDDLYADILLWQKNKWIDYVVPQIYWQIGMKVANYSVLADWWSKNAFGCKLYIGQAPYRISKKSTVKEWRTSKEIIRQISLNHTYPNISGSMFFSGKFIRNNPLKITDRLVKGPYKLPALTPSNNRITPVIPEIPKNPVIKVENSSVNLQWEKGAGTKEFVVYKFVKGKPARIDDPANIFHVSADTSLTIPVNSKTDPAKYYFVVTSISYTNSESDPVYFNQ